MKIAKLIVIAVIFFVFSVFMGLQSYTYGMGGFASAFFVTLAFSAFIFLFQVEYYIFAVKSFVHAGEAETESFQHPLDIWLIAIPMAVLMVITYAALKWPVVEVFYCTTLALTGMLFGNGLGRGTKKWHIKKSLPFFFGVVASTLFALIAGGLMG
jgi:hypothetical protein